MNTAPDRNGMEEPDSGGWAAKTLSTIGIWLIAFAMLIPTTMLLCDIWQCDHYSLCHCINWHCERPTGNPAP